MRSIGIRELRQRASEYIRLVREGETIQVTDRGTPVALLTPVRDESESDYERAVREGRIRKGVGSLEDIQPQPAVPGEKTLSEILREMRDEEYS